MDTNTSNKNNWNKFLVGIGIALMTLVTTYLVHTNPNLNLADLTNTGVTGIATDKLYMPSYTGGVGEEGQIEIKTKQTIPAFDSLTFSLKYNPVNALTFKKNPLVFDNLNTALFPIQESNVAFQMTANPEPGKLIVTVILEAPVTITDVTTNNVATHQTLFKLNTQLNSDLPQGQVINVTFSDLAMLNGANPLVVPDMPASTITVEGQDELKVVSAESIDSTHVLVEFSDYLSDLDNTTAYDITPGPLAVTLVESGSVYGYSQKYVMLTTAAQTAGAEYVMTVDPLSTITSNQQGSVDVNFSQAPFYGFGAPAGILSDFGMASAVVSGYDTITVTFTDAVQEASVTKSDFNLAIQGAGAIAVTNVSSISGKDVVLKVASPLLKEKTYLLSAASPSSILRQSDGAGLGMDRISFVGAKNGPRLIGATVSNTGGVYTAQFTFDENIQIGRIDNNPVGRLYNTSTGSVIAANADPINDASILIYSQTISGATLSISTPTLNSASTNFTFSTAPGWLTNSLGVSVEDTYSTVSFWGYGHDNNQNTVGTPTVSKKDAFRVPAGNLDFSTLLASNVTVFYNNNATNLSTQAITSIGTVGGELEVVMAAPLDPDQHYVVRIKDNSNNLLAARDFSITRALNISSVQAISSTDVRVFFSSNIDERDVDRVDFSVKRPDDTAVAISSMTIDPDYKSVVLKTAGPFEAGTIYKVAIINLPDVYSYTGNATLLHAMYFTGYQTQSAKSPVKIQSIEVLDSKKIRMNFTGTLDQNSFTPVNVSIFRFTDPTSPAARETLTVTAITKVDNDTYELSTGAQTAAKNYFVVFNGVKDANGLQLVNHKVSNFFGFELPQAAIHLVTPNKATNDLETNIVLTGNNLDLVKEVRVGNKTMTIVSQSKTSLTFTVPASFEAGLYAITLVDQADAPHVFKDALLITVPEQKLTIHSEQSQSIPLNVPNDGVTKVKLWLLVEDPVGLSSISSVVVDLTQVGGPATAEMKKDTGTQPQYSQWYTYETVIPVTVQTKETPYLLPVEVRKGSEKYTGTLSVHVTKDVVKSVAPKIDQVYISPLSVPPDGTTPVKISAQITDPDGAATINSVVADLGSLGIGFKPLKPMSEVTAGVELETQFFASEEFTVPKTTQLGKYTINVVASDVTGEKSVKSIELEVSTVATGPIIDKDLTYVSPRKSIPRDGKTVFSIHTFVSDPDGIVDIQTVSANFSSMGLPPVSLKKDVEAPTEGKGAWFQSGPLVVPKTAPLGTHEVEVRATDKAGGVSNRVLQVEVTFKDTLGDPPRLVEDRSYTTPRTAVNDGKTPVTLYAFVQDDDADIQSVIVNLSEIGQVGSQTTGIMGSAGSASAVPNPVQGSISGECPTGSNVLVCMNASVKEGLGGQWFILPNVTVNITTVASPDPYEVDVVVADAGGKTTRGVIPVYVGTADAAAAGQEPPKALAAIPADATSIEVLFNKELSVSSLAKSGKDFTISSDSDVNDMLSIVGATINPAGTVVTLSTANQDPGKRYVLSVSKNVKDLVGRGIQEGSANRLNFTGFMPLKKAPMIEYIQASDVNLVEVEFKDNLKPSSVRSGVSQTDASARFGVTIYESENTSKRLDVLGISLQAPGNVLQIITGPQVSEQKYRITLEGLQSYDGTAISAPLNKGFKGYNLKVAQHKAAANYADLNNDGRVDFSDFTIFSSVYGTVYIGQGKNLNEAAKKAAEQAAKAIQTGQPLTPVPDALVPTTSTPAGGTVTN